MKQTLYIIALLVLELTLLCAPVGVYAQALPGGQSPRGSGGCTGVFDFVDEPPYYAGRSYLVDITFQGDCAGKRGDVLRWVNGESLVVVRLPLSKTWNMSRANISFPEGGTNYGLSAYAFPGGKMAFAASGGMVIDVQPDPLTNPAPAQQAPPTITEPTPTSSPLPNTNAPITPEPVLPANNNNGQILLPGRATTSYVRPSFLQEPQAVMSVLVDLPIHFNTLGELIVALIRFALAMIGVFSILFIIIGAMRMVTSHGDEKAVTAGKQTVTWAVLGLVVALVSFSLITWLQIVLARK